MAYNVMKGSQSDDVKAVQQTLIDAGYDLGAGGADGIFGADTEAAVRKFQQNNGLAVDGIVGKNTTAALQGAQNKTPSAPVNNTPSAPATTSTPASTNTSSKMSDFGPEILVTDANGVTFDLNKDYSKAEAEATTPEEKAEMKVLREAKTNSAAYGGKYQTGVNEAASLGTTYNPNKTIVNRTSNSDPIITVTKPTMPTGNVGTTATGDGATTLPSGEYTPTQSTTPTLRDLNQLQTGTYTAPNIDSTINKADISAMISYLDQWLAQAKQQQSQSIDYATETAVKDLQRTEEEAAKTFQEQRNQIAIEEARAKDNQALYAERRGDRGGVGAAQYDSVMNTAAKNRLAVNNAQTKLATDTSRQIADLRARGEYEKADALLNLTQQYLSQIISLEQWSMDYGLSEAQFRASLQQWEASFEAQMAEITGIYKGQQTLAYQQAQNDLIKYQNDLALSKEQLAMQQANLTGIYNGQLTLDYVQMLDNAAKWEAEFLANTTGEYNGQPTVAYQQYLDSQAAAQKQQLAQNGWTMLQAGHRPSESQIKAMDLSAAQVDSLLTYYQAQGKVNESADNHIQKMLDFNDDGKALTYLASLGYSNDVHNQLWAMYELERAGKQDPDDVDIKTYADAVNRLKLEGLTESDYAGQLLTEAQWNRVKESYPDPMTKKAYTSYEEYLVSTILKILGM